MTFFRLIKLMLFRMYDSLEKNVQYSEPRFVTVGAIATIGFPLYYIIWSAIFPQPYENLSLRLFGSILFSPLVFTKYWPSKLRKGLAIYWYFSILYALPFFFTFMLLKNQQSTVWAMSALIAIFVMILLLDGLNLLVQFVLGVGLGCLAFYWTDNAIAFTSFPWEYLPVYLFAIFLGVATNFSGEKINQEKLSATLAAASTIAHELRTPLLGIKSGATGLNQYLPILLDAYQQAKQHQLAVSHIRGIHLQSMQQVLARINSEVDYSNKIIDMLLMNAQTQSFNRESFTWHSMQQCIDIALQRYPFSSEQERNLITQKTSSDFIFYGVELLMTHVLFNLLKNALYHITKTRKGTIFLHIECETQVNILKFRDTSSGIPPEILPYLFTRFFSWSEDNSTSTGAGLGLSFCKAVIESFGGTITCHSKFGEYTEFVMTFPKEKST